MNIKVFIATIFTSCITTALSITGLYLYTDTLPVQMTSDSTAASSVSEPATTMTSSDIPDIVEETIPAVVSIIATAEVPVIERYYDDFWSPFGGLFGGGVQIPRERQIGTERQEIGGGTGFFVSSDGYLITNRHVVDRDGVEYSVVTNSDETYPASVVAKDPMLDVAILKVDTDQDLPYLTFASTSAIRLGEPVIAIGNALAEFPNSVSVGVVSGLSRNIVASDGLRRSEALEGVIQTDAAINRGNSGGPLINSSGRVIGVNVAVAGNGENIGFALPADSVQGVYDSVAEHGEIIRPFLGVRYMQITPDIVERNNLDTDYGVLVVRGETRGDLAVIPGSPADKAGLRENDIILQIDEQILDGSISLAGILRSYSVGDSVTLQILRAGEEMNMTVTLESQ